MRSPLFMCMSSDKSRDASICLIFSTLDSKRSFVVRRNRTTSECLAASGQSACRGQCLHDGFVAADFVPPWVRDLTTSDEIRSVKLAKKDGDLRIVQSTYVLLGYERLQLRQGQVLNIDLSCSFQGNEAIRLNGDRLVELRSKGKADFEHVVWTQPV